jgi:hypothetical protein
MLSRIKSAKKRNMILKELNRDKVLFDALSELAHNHLKGNIPIGYNQTTLNHKKLKRHTKLLRALDCPKSRKCASKRKKLIEQSGGFLPILIPAAAAALGELSGAIIKKIIK